MAWTAPIDWADNDDVPSGIVTASMLNEQIRDNLGMLNLHTHTGAAGLGASTLDGVTFTGIVNLSFNVYGAPVSTGQLRRNGNDLQWYGAAVVNLTAEDATSGASLRTIGTGAYEAAAGNHTHTDVQNFLTGVATWTKPANATVVLVELLAGGGGGAGNVVGTGTPDDGGGGGGGGGRVTYMFDADDLEDTAAVTIVPGGFGGAAGASGTAGGHSIFAPDGGLFSLTAYGGGGGAPAGSGGVGGEGNGGAGGASNGGAGVVALIGGGGGGGGGRDGASGGAGGVSNQGGNGGAGGSSGAVGNAGVAPSGGGGGAGGGTTDRAGGAGAGGKARVISYINFVVPTVPF